MLFNTDLTLYGWNSYWQKAYEKMSELDSRMALYPARVLEQQAHRYRLITSRGEVWAEVSMRFTKSTNGTGDYPAVGDWVTFAEPTEGLCLVERLLPRVSCFSRRAAGLKPDEQVVSANVDTVLIVTGVVSDFHPRRLERYLVTAWDSGASPVVVLTKVDLLPNLETITAQAKSVAMSAPVVLVSSVTSGGLDGLAPYLVKGKTLALLGSSGVGKSSIINGLLGMDIQLTNGLRKSDGRGRHTTTHRELFLLPHGTCMIDTPGMREIQLWDGQEGIKHTFGDIEELAQHCRFRDCKHIREPNCAVKLAIENGDLDSSRYKNYLSLQRELAHQVRKQASKSTNASGRVR